MENEPVERADSGIALVLVSALIVGIITMMVFRYWELNAKSELPWFAEHPVLSGLIGFGVALVVGRMYLFIRRLESRR